MSKGRLFKVLGSIVGIVGFFYFMAWMDRENVARSAAAAQTLAAGQVDTAAGYRLKGDAATTPHELTAGDSIRFGLLYAAGGTLITDADHFFKGTENDAIMAVKGLGDHGLANGSNGAVFLAPGGQAGAASATVSLVDRPPPTTAFDRTIDVSLPAPSGTLLLAPNGNALVSDSIALPRGDYTARIRVRGPENGEDVRIDLWPAGTLAGA